MSNNKGVIIGLAAFSIIGIIGATYLYFENIKKNIKIAELQKDNLKLILDSLKQSPSLSEEQKRQLEKLIKDFENIDNKVSRELAQALKLLQIGQHENAIEDLAKIIEHLLTIHYKETTSFTNWLKEQKQQINLHNLLTFCKKEEKINEIEFQFFIAIKTIRNKEDHTLDLNLDKYLNAAGLITAIGGIFKISSFVYPKSNLSPITL